MESYICIFLRQGLLPMNKDILLIRGVRELKHTSSVLPSIMAMLCALTHADYSWAVQLRTETRIEEENNQMKK